MASIIKDASIVDVGKSRHTNPARLWGIFLPSCASRDVAVVNTLAQATLSPTRARDSTLAMQNRASRSIVFQYALFSRWAPVGSPWPAPILQTRRQRKSRRAEMLLPQEHVSIALSFLCYFLPLIFSSVSVISNKHRINQ